MSIRKFNEPLMKFLKDFDDPELPQPYWVKTMFSAIRNFNYTYGVLIEPSILVLDEYKHWKFLRRWKRKY